jgi:lipopolysaccharide biosynthesis glycosyltransferase
VNDSFSVWIGFDPREAAAFAVAKESMRKHMIQPIPIRGIMLDKLREDGLYTRRTERRDGRLWDEISEAPMSTEFAISRFLTPHLAKEGWALFTDCDVMARKSLVRLFDLADPKYAIMCVKHRHDPPEGEKMDGQIQTRYFRKNWSSVMLFNCAHPANRLLTVEMINERPGRELHAFCWLEDREIGELPAEWNYLVGHTQTNAEPALVHFTDGIPSMPGYEKVPYADEWRSSLRRWAA